MREHAVAVKLRAFHRAWLSGQLDDLPALFHPEVVMLPPGPGAALTGRDALVQSIRDYVTNATTTSFAESELRVDAFGDTAVASFRFDITYLWQGAEHREAGRETWVWMREDGEWRAVWRTQVPVAT
ncbi:MAG: DUF4440 domain-containing protein [Planctomycetota bacterium]